MFHLLVKYDGWAEARDSMPLARVLEYTSDDLVERFKPGGTLKLDVLTRLPALFVSETRSTGDQRARAGALSRVRVSGRDVTLDYAFNQAIPAIPNSVLQRFAGELDIDSFEFTRTHWSIKNVDLYRVLMQAHASSFPSPKVFKLQEIASASHNLVSVMMPFAREFNGVYDTLQAVAKDLKLKCLRADDIWEHDTVIQDIVSLISSSRVVICDCTGRNPNVFYEAGIAHTLGRDVILIARNEDDVPFDLRHLRYVQYSNTAKGRRQLAERVTRRIESLLGKRTTS